MKRRVKQFILFATSALIFSFKNPGFISSYCILFFIRAWCNWATHSRASF